MDQPNPALAVTIAAAVVSVGGARFPQTMWISGYSGKPLFCHAASDGQTLTILVDENDPGPAQPPGNPATSADVTIVFDRTTVRWTVHGIAYTAGSPVTLKMRVTTDFKQAYLYIRDHGDVESQDDTPLQFILIEEEGDQEPRYRLEWISNKIMVDKADTRLTASIVPPAPSGGAMGPMGLATP